MSQYSRTPTGKLGRRASGRHDVSEFFDALHRKQGYRSSGDSASGSAEFSVPNHGQWVLSPRTRQRVGLLVRENGVTIFQRLVSEHKHKLHKLAAWGLETDLLAHVEKLGATWLRIMASDTKRRLCVPLRLFRERGELVGYGYGAQRALKERYFADCVSEDALPECDLPQDQEGDHSEPIQGSLFGGEQHAA